MESAENPYMDLRETALKATMEQLELPNGTEVYGVVMDLSLGDGIATLVSYETGDASIYLSSGGGMIGGRAHEAVAAASQKFVAEARDYVSAAGRIDAIPLPEEGEVIFYFLTAEGRFAVKDDSINFENESSPLLPLFFAANNVITQLRIVNEKQ